MRDLPLQADKSHLSRCQRCVWSARTILATVATSDAYAALAVEMARSAAAVGVASCACVVVSDAVRAIGDAVVEQVVLPWSSTWRPPTSWCTRRLSGWRHAGILKTHSLLELLRHDWDVFFVDVDWRFASNPLPAVVKSGKDVVSARDQTRHMLNVGALWVRSTALTLELARRTLNRTVLAWDQAVFTEEAGASAASCCWANLGRQLVHPRVSRKAKVSVGRRVRCRGDHNAEHHPIAIRNAAPFVGVSRHSKPGAPS